MVAVLNTNNTFNCLLYSLSAQGSDFFLRLISVNIKYTYMYTCMYTCVDGKCCKQLQIILKAIAHFQINCIKK